jgi:hypothetical protein
VRKKEPKHFLCNGWQLRVISPQLHGEVEIDNL